MLAGTILASDLLVGSRTGRVPTSGVTVAAEATPRLAEPIAPVSPPPDDLRSALGGDLLRAPRLSGGSVGVAATIARALRDA